ncbi:hypothetical protein C8034_v005436 [Colletotrichum sidae]|uniref:Uncharacterized protein n=1 Tax=Colletotrichum sidae TaxID=1347389 RepID=A0A4R8TSX1_9PEZI|nr:hypothetical protein C8034_v005436 [Colletotrichum sidae]
MDQRSPWRGESPASSTPAQTPRHTRLLSRGLSSATPVTNTPATSASNGKEGTPASDKVLAGRISKTPQKPAAKKFELSKKEEQAVQKHLDDMNAEKKLFPGSDNWADDEVRLFKILYMRQYSPLLPSDWSMDFLGHPIPEILLASSVDNPPTINSRSDNNYKATKALKDLLTLTEKVRSTVQAGKRPEARLIIEKGLRDYSKWAEQDGGYAHLDYLPNIIIDVVDTTLTPKEIEDHMQAQLRKAAVRQRGHWAVEQAFKAAQDGNENGHQSVIDPEEAEPEDNRVVLVPDKYPAPTPQKSPLAQLTASPQNPDADGSRKDESANEKVDKKTTTGKDVFRPPVVYGLFIVNTSVMVVTMDSAKEEPYLSYQVEVGFNKRGQAVWNALTIAIVVCLARDAMMEMKNGFEVAAVTQESDPDA